MDHSSIIALRFQRAELERHGSLSPAGLERLAQIGHPARLIDVLATDGNHRDALCVLTLLLPHRQTVWWACLAVRTVPNLESRPGDLSALIAAERWVHSQVPGDAERAGDILESCSNKFAPYWAATAAYWAGPSLAPRGQPQVPPPPHLPGIAARAALLMLGNEPGLEGAIDIADWLGIGMSLMRGDTGAEAQMAVRSKIRR